MSKGYWLTDCSPIHLTDFSKAYFGGGGPKNLRLAASWLQKLAGHHWADDSYFSFGRANKNDVEPVVYTDPTAQWWTGRYVGSITFEGKTIDIKPRFGFQFAMDNMPLVNVLGVDINRSFGRGGQFIHFLQSLLWLNKLVIAARHALPSVRKDEYHESLICRGRLDVRRTIKQRAKASDKVVSVSRYKDLLNPVSIAIVLAFKEIQRGFPKHDVMRLLPSTVAMRLQKLIDVVKRHSKIPTYNDIAKVRLASLARDYQSLAVMSLDILKQKGVAERDGTQRNKTLLLDVAELWEHYLLGVLRGVAGEDYAENLDVVYSARDDGDYLLSSHNGGRGLGRLLPDYLIQQFGKTVVIADAKYKKLGDALHQSPKRDDLYQMTAYLSAKPDCKHCLVLYPKWNEGSLSRVETNNPWFLVSDQSISFVTVSPDKATAVAEFSSLDAFSNAFKNISIAG